ncbi:MAG: response regulator transcription factor [Saprospiraceae bacterium]|nr:response regulator transcription factor [Saprospiraceae bacterium]
MKKVLVVEDDRDIIALLEIHLKDLDCQLVTATDGEEGLRLALSQNFDLVILDLMLPKLDGMEVCRQIRQKQLQTPVLMLTARSEEIDKVLGLELGADDYMTKPFSVREFIARVKALFRRTRMHATSDNSGFRAGNAHSQQLMHYGALEIDLDKRKVSIDQKRIDLSPKEFELLSLLASNPGKSYDRSKILNLIWGYDFDGYEHTVNSHINRLRSKIEPDISSPKYILTTWGVGYRFNEDLL